MSSLEEGKAMDDVSLQEHNRAQVILWLAQAAQITAAQDRGDVVDAIYARMLDLLAIPKQGDE